MEEILLLSLYFTKILLVGFNSDFKYQNPGFTFQLLSKSKPYVSVHTRHSSHPHFDSLVIFSLEIASLISAMPYSIFSLPPPSITVANSLSAFCPLCFFRFLS